MIAFFSALLTVLSVHAQKADTGVMNLSYGSASWNTDSTKIDSAYMVMRDKTTGKMVQIQLEETEPDSSKFDGKFHVQLGDKPLDPQVYVPPKELRNAERDYKKVNELIQNNKLASKPLIMKKNDKGQSLIDVYDTPDQADAAKKAYEEQQRLEAEAKHQKLIKPVPDKDKVAAAIDAEKQAQLAKAALDAAKREADRIRIEQIERQKAIEREKALKAATEKEKAERRAKAKTLAEEGVALMKAGDFKGAEEKFRQAVDFDPENKSYYYSYANSLYRNEKLNEALVIAKLADVDPKLEAERQYLIGLIHYRLKEYDPAIAALNEAGKSPDPYIGPSAVFYKGVVQFTKDDLDGAKKSFEQVIDTSQDPKMDQQAEQYIDSIMARMQFKEMQKKPWTATGIVGAQYDSNVTSSPDTASSGSSTDKSDFRLNTVADLAYRAVYTEKNELILKGDANLTNSSKSEVSIADPFIYNISAGYNYKGVAFGKGYVLGLKPAYELLYMDPYSTGKKDEILNSIVLDIDNTFVMRTDYVAVYSLQVRKDDFSLNDSDGDNNYDAMKYNLKTSQIFYMDKARKEAITANLGYVLNNASGKNKQFSRYDLGVTFTKPMKWGYAWNIGLSMYQLDYSKADSVRHDRNLAFTTGLDKPIKDWLTWSVSGTYTNNNSNIQSSYEYDKYVILTSATFTKIF